MTNKEFMTEVLKRHGLTDKPQKFEGKWVYPSDFRKPLKGEIAFYDISSLHRITGHDWKSSLTIIYTPCDIPPRPDAETIKRLTPAGKVMTVNDEPDLESAPYVTTKNELSQLPDRSGCATRDFHGLRYGVTIKDAPVVEYWRHIDGDLIKTENGIITEDSCKGIKSIGHKLLIRVNWIKQITAEEYEAANVKQEQPKPLTIADVPMKEIEPHELLLLKLRNAIADKEFATAYANRQLDMGGWTQDWQHEQNVNDTRIAELLEKIEAVNALQRRDK